MGDSKILLVEKDMEYGMALAEAVSSLHSEFEFTAVGAEGTEFRGPTPELSVSEYDFILIGGQEEEFARSCFPGAAESGKVAFLADRRVEPLLNQLRQEGKQFRYLYKYTNVNNLISDLNLLMDSVAGRKSLIRKSLASEIIGFYSAAGGTGKSVVALAAARELSRYHEKKVLFLSFEEIPATDLFFPRDSGNRNLGDYLYYLFEKKDGNPKVLPDRFTVADQFGVDTFLPAVGRNDLSYLDREELALFLKTISDDSGYDYLVLDLKNDLSEETIFLLEQSEKIIMVETDSPLSRFKTREYAGCLERRNAGYWDRIILAVNRCGGSDGEGVEESEEQQALSFKNIKRVRIEKDENSFRYRNHSLDVDINHAFGMGIKKLTGEILSADGRINRCTENCAR